MDQVKFRIAINKDVQELAEMRWDFRTEDHDASIAKDDFLAYCTDFLRAGLESGRWVYWVAEIEGMILSHIFIQKIRKVPKPNCLEEHFAYLTNVYTRPAYRNQGIGSKLLTHVLAWAEAQDLEALLVWPSENSKEFYRRSGFDSTEAFEKELRPYIP